MRLKVLYEKYRDAVEFIVLYIGEAHPTDKWWLGRSRTQRAIHELSDELVRVDIEEPVTLAQRQRAARQISSTAWCRSTSTRWTMR